MNCDSAPPFRAKPSKAKQDKYLQEEGNGTWNGKTMIFRKEKGKGLNSDLTNICAAPPVTGSWLHQELPRVLKLTFQLREVSSLSMRTIYSFQKRSYGQTYVNNPITWLVTWSGVTNCDRWSLPLETRRPSGAGPSVTGSTGLSQRFKWGYQGWYSS